MGSEDDTPFDTSASAAAAVRRGKAAALDSSAPAAVRRLEAALPPPPPPPPSNAIADTSTPPVAVPRPAMGMVTRSKKRRLEEEEDLLAEKRRTRDGDRISSLPDDVLGDIVSLLPTKDGARTQILSSRWRPQWRAAPLNLHIQDDPYGSGIRASDISRIIAAHPGPCRRFVMPRRYTYKDPCRTTMDAWLCSPVLDNLQELHYCNCGLPLPSVGRFSSTLRVASFRACWFPDGNDASPMSQLPLLKQLTLFDVRISEGALHALLAGCPVLESLLLLRNRGFDQLKIVSSSLRSIGVHSGDFSGTRLHQLVIEDAPCLERLLYFGGDDVSISVTSAPRLAILGELCDGIPRLQFGATVLKGSTIVSMPAVVPSVKVLALDDVELFLDAVINLMQCFPHLQNLYIKITRDWGKDWCTGWKPTTTLDIGLRRIVLRNYQGKKQSHINLARFFISNARMLESMRFEIKGENVTSKWIGRQQRVLQIKKSASRVAQFDFVSPSILTGSLDDQHEEQVHDLSVDPFHRFH